MRLARVRRLLQFSLRTCLIMLTIACLWLGWQVNRAQRQRKAVQWLARMAGAVDYDYEATGAEAPGPDWLRERIGIDYFDGVVSAELAGPQVLDVSALAGLAQLETLDLSRTLVHEVSAIAEMQSLKHLNLNDTLVVDLSPLSKLSQLESIDLSTTLVEDISPLSHLPRLTVLSVRNAPLTEIPDLPRSLRGLTSQTQMSATFPRLQSCTHSNICDCQELLSAVFGPWNIWQTSKQWTCRGRA